MAEPGIGVVRGGVCLVVGVVIDLVSNVLFGYVERWWIGARTGIGVGVRVRVHLFREIVPEMLIQSILMRENSVNINP